MYRDNISLEISESSSRDATVGDIKLCIFTKILRGDALQRVLLAVLITTLAHEIGSVYLS
jgi:hypothetical protein